MDPLRRAMLIDQVLASEGWREVFAPLLMERKRAMEHALRNPSLLSKHKIPPDYARGQLDLVDYLLEHPQEIAETDRNAAVEETLADRRDSVYSSLADLGYGHGELGLLDEFNEA